MLLAWRNCINENARKLQDQNEYEKKYASLLSLQEASGKDRNLASNDSQYKIQYTFNIVKPARSTVTFKDGDKTHATVKAETGKAIDTDDLKDQSMPKSPAKDGYTFKEWNTKADGTGVKFTGKTVVNSDMTVYAIYVEDPLDIPDFPYPIPDSVPDFSHILVPNPVPSILTPSNVLEPEPSEATPEPASEPENKPVKEQKSRQAAVHDLPKTGESASLVALFASLAFFVAGLLMHKKKVVRESK